MVLEATRVEELARELEGQHPGDVLKLALEEYGERLAISFSGAEDVVLIAMATREAERLGTSFRVFTLDTGRLHGETYRFLETVQERYGVTIEAFFPQPEAVQALVREKGYFSFYRDDHPECCGIRKVEPLRRALAGVPAYVTGQRRDQSPDTRNAVPMVQLDDAFAEPGSTLVKFNPLAGWSSAQVWRYIREHDVPYNPLHDRGFRSIGCEPCTRATHPGEHEREGRWWWEEATKKECGIHALNERSARP
jgi:phosphoadenosine phosphosulfate reductase